MNINNVNNHIFESIDKKNDCSNIKEFELFLGNPSFPLVDSHLTEILITTSMKRCKHEII